MRIVLSGPQSQYKKAQSALTSAGFSILLNDVGSPDPSSHGFADSAETRWTGAVYSADDIAAIAEDNPEHGLQVGDIVRGTGEIVPVESKAPTCFVTVDGPEEDVDKAAQAVAELGWVLRAHFVPSDPPAKTPTAEILRQLGIDPSELKKLIGA